MLNKSCLGLLASAALTANTAFAADHRHAQRHQHAKKAIVYETTTTEIDMTYTTVYVDGYGNVIGGAEPTAAGEVFVTSSSAAPTTSSSSVVVRSSSSSSYVAPTTMVTSVTAAAAPTYVAPAAAAVVESSSSTTATDIISQAVSAVSSAVAAATSAASVSTGSGSSNKRGAAYNSASLVSPLIGTGSKVSWAYNWGQTSDGLSEVSSSLEFVPMLWGNKEQFFQTWSSNAKAAIASGSKYLLSFNEPDNAGQANMAASQAASYHQQYMNPLSGSASIGAPSITNSNTAGESLDWLSSWIDACGGKCDFDFCPVHWYNTIEAGAEDLLNFVTKAQSTCGEGKTIWVTEFAPNVDNPSQEQISEFLTTVQDAFDNNSTYSFVERYSYFYVADGMLVSGSSATTSGNTFAYA